MLGAAPETRGSIAAVVEAYRAHGLFKRWPIDYVATHGDGSTHRASLAMRALATSPRCSRSTAASRVHVHTAAHAASGATAAFMLRGAWPLAARCSCSCTATASTRFCGSSNAPRRDLRALRGDARLGRDRLARSPRGGWRRRAVALRTGAVPMRPAKPNLILFLGRLEPRRASSTCSKRSPRCAPRIPDVRLVCAGDGERIAVARYAERLGIADAVKFTGWVGPSGKRALLENAAVFALPSYDEALPVSLLEAMGAGVPVVASPVGGIPEVVVDGVSGSSSRRATTTTLERLLRKVLIDRALGRAHRRRGPRVGAPALRARARDAAPGRALRRARRTPCDGAAGRSVARQLPLKKAA